MPKKRVTVFGSGSCKPGDKMYEVAEAIGVEIAVLAATTVTGGYRGVMEAASKGAREIESKTIGFHLGIEGLQPNDFLDTAVDCSSLFPSATTIERVSAMRRGCLLDSDGFIAVAGGGSGTLGEVLDVIHLNLKLWEKDGGRRIALVEVEGECSWEKLLDFLKSMELPLEELGHLILVTDDPGAAALWVLDEE